MSVSGTGGCTGVPLTFPEIQLVTDLRALASAPGTPRDDVIFGGIVRDIETSNPEGRRP